MSPQVTVAVAEIAEPPAAGPCLEHHRHRGVLVTEIGRAELLEQRGKRLVDRGADADLFDEIERHLIYSRSNCSHEFSFQSGLKTRPYERVILHSRSARRLMRPS